MKLVAPLEVGLSVRDLEGMVGFYRDVLGFEEISSIAVPPDKSTAATFSDHGYTIVRLQLGTGERLKLARPNEPPDKPAPAKQVLDRQGPAFLTFILDDLDAAIAEMVAEGVVLRTGPKKVEIRDGVFLCFAEDPEGNHLELVEYADIAAYRPDYVGND